MGKIIQRMSESSRLRKIVFGSVLIGSIFSHPSYSESELSTIYTQQKHITDGVLQKDNCDVSALKEEVRLKREVVREQVKIEQSKEDISWSTFKMTHYTAGCEGCSGITFSGYDVRNTTEYEGMNVVAVDRRKIPIGSIIEIKEGESEESYKAIALDIGGAIKGSRLDMLVSNKKEAREKGVKQVSVRIVREGW